MSRAWVLEPPWKKRPCALLLHWTIRCSQRIVPWNLSILLMEKILQQLIGSLSQGLMHLMCCKISANITKLVDKLGGFFQWKWTPGRGYSFWKSIMFMFQPLVFGGISVCLYNFYHLHPSTCCSWVIILHLDPEVESWSHHGPTGPASPHAAHRGTGSRIQWPAGLRRQPGAARCWLQRWCVESKEDSSCYDDSDDADNQ